MHSFLNTWMWVSFIRNKQYFELKYLKNTMNWFIMIIKTQMNTPKLDSHYYLFIGHILFITLHIFDAVLCLMMGCIRKLKNAAFGGRISRQGGIKARPNPKLASLLSHEISSSDRFVKTAFVSFAAFDIPQSCAAARSMTVELKNNDGVWKLRLVVSLCVNVYFWLTFCTFDVISSEKLVLIEGNSIWI